MKLWMYLHFPMLQLNALYCERASQMAGNNKGDSKRENQGAEPSDHGALVIVEGRRNAIIQLNQKAQDEGIRIGMGLATAASLCSDLQVHPYDADCEREKLKEIAHWLYLLTSDICLFEANGLLLQVSNMLTLYDGLESYWQAISQHLSELEFDYDYACGYSPYAARILARQHLNQVTQSEQIIRQALQASALSETDLSTKQVEKLARVGILCIKDILSIPLSDLAKRFDAELVNYIGRLSGHFHHAVSFYHPPELFDRSLDLLFEIENTQWLEKPLLKLLGYLERFLRIRDLFAHELSLDLIMRDDGLHELKVIATSAAGEYLPNKWLALFKLRFESVKLKAPVLRIRLVAVRVQARRGDTADLFDGRRGNTSAMELVSTLQAKLGEDAVHGVALTEDPRPHLSSQYCQPLSAAASVLPHSNLPTRNPNLLRPGILLPQPQPLRQKVSLVEGPERLATGWWDAHPVVRDYFIARASNGSWLWIFRTPEQQWFLHGVFS